MMIGVSDWIFVRQGAAVVGIQLKLSSLRVAGLNSDHYPCCQWM